MKVIVMIPFVHSTSQNFPRKLSLARFAILSRMSLLAEGIETGERGRAHRLALRVFTRYRRNEKMRLGLRGILIGYFY